MTSLLRRFVLVVPVALGLALAPQLVAQQEPGAPAGESQEAQEPTREPIPRPATVEEVGPLDAGEFSDALQERSVEELTAALGHWQQLFTRAVAEREAATGPQQQAAANAALDQVSSFASTLAQAVVDAGGDAGSILEQIEQVGEATRTAAQEEAVRGIAMAEALVIDVKVLKARMRPLPAEKVKEALDAWVVLLERKAREFSNAEIAVLAAEKAGESAEADRVNARMVDLRRELDALQTRFQAIVKSYRNKGADAAEADAYAAYADSVVAPLEISGFRSAWVQAREWLTDLDGGVGTLVGFVTDLVLFLAIFLAFRWLAKLVGRILDRSIGAMNRSSALLRNFLVNTTKKIVVFVGLVVALGQIGVDIGPFLAAIGAAGFVIGFALQGTLSNFANGVMIMIYRPYDIGDVVDMAGIVGTVNDMTLVSTTVRTFDNQTIVIPNSKIWGDVITNITANSTRRVDMTFGIGYDDDIQKALEVLNDIVHSHPKVLKDPEPTIQLHELGDSSLNFICRPWVGASDYWAVYWEITRQVKERFDAAGISIPFPQRDVHLYQVAEKSD
jgi:small conductance mechanosensitive channel